MTAYTIDAARTYLREVAEAEGWLDDLDALLAQPIGYAHVLPGFHDAWAAYNEAEFFDEVQMGEMVGALGMVEAIARPGCLSDRQAARERIARMERALDAENAVHARILTERGRVHKAHGHADVDCSPSVCVEAARLSPEALAEWERELLLGRND